MSGEKLCAGAQDLATSDASLFSEERLLKLSKWSDIKTQLDAQGLIARPLMRNDYDRGYLELLSQLTTVGDVSKSEFEARFDQMKCANQVAEHYAIVVLEDSTSNRIVGASTLFLEYKFIHQCAMRGRLEDVAVLDSYRGRRIGKLVVKIIIELAREPYKCYKLSLDCREDLKRFYAKNGFEFGSNMLAIRF